jgi:hypothetical protein
MRTGQVPTTTKYNRSNLLLSSQSEATFAPAIPLGAGALLAGVAPPFATSSWHSATRVKSTWRRKREETVFSIMSVLVLY